MTTIDTLVRILDEERTKRIDSSHFAANKIMALEVKVSELEAKVNIAETSKALLTKHIKDVEAQYEAKIKEWEKLHSDMLYMIPKTKRGLVSEHPGYPACYVPF